MSSAFTVTALSVGLVVGAGCAKDPTSVLVTVDADATTPALLILRTTVARTDNPATESSSERSSPAQGDAADRPGPFLFPFDLSLTVDPSFAGPVTITVEGLDWDTHAVTARGTTPATVVAQKSTTASLTLTGVVNTGSGDGGTD
jgi:hypothetical protein